MDNIIQLYKLARKICDRLDVLDVLGIKEKKEEKMEHTTKANSQLEEAFKEQRRVINIVLSLLE